MPTREQLAKELAATVAGVSHNATFKDADGKSTLDQEEAVYQYIPDQNIMIMINYENTDVEVWYDPTTTDIDWFSKQFSPRIKSVARRYLYGTTIKSYDGDIEPKKMVHRTEKVTEGRNSLKISYHPLGGTQIRLAHTKSVTEEKPGARSRNIQALFVEKDGERFRFPYNHLLGARVMALHVESGGKPWDELGTKIVEISRRRKEVMELLRWSKRLEETEEVSEIRTRGKNEVIMLKRMMERAARTGDLSNIVSYQLPKPGQPIIPNDMVAEAVSDLENSLNSLFG